MGQKLIKSSNNSIRHQSVWFLSDIVLKNTWISKYNDCDFSSVSKFRNTQEKKTNVHTATPHSISRPSLLRLVEQTIVLQPWCVCARVCVFALVLTLSLMLEGSGNKTREHLHIFSTTHHRFTRWLQIIRLLVKSYDLMLPNVFRIMMLVKRNESNK